MHSIFERFLDCTEIGPSPPLGSDGLVRGMGGGASAGTLGVMVFSKRLVKSSIEVDGRRVFSPSYPLDVMGSGESWSLSSPFLILYTRVGMMVRYIGDRAMN